MGIPRRTAGECARIEFGVGPGSRKVGGRSSTRIADRTYPLQPTNLRNFPDCPQSCRNGMSIVLAGKRGITTMSVGSVRLRLEAEDGTAAREYRIHDGNVEVRHLHPPGGHD